jgi:Ca2+-binding EF-hand superfamily protein
MKKTIIATVSVIALMGALPAGAEEAKTQTQTRTYSYDSNKDGYIQPEEFATYLYTRSDMDDDGYMGDEEWKLTTSQFYRPYKDVDYNNYTYWDQDKDGRLDNNEVKTLIEKTGLYSKWDTDTDGKVSNAEFDIGTFNAYDDNGDGTLNLEEWKSVLR